MAGTATDDRVYRVVEPFSFYHNGRTYVMRRGDIVSADNPAYNGGRASLFEEVTPESARDEQSRTSVRAVETATAAPGAPRRMEIDASVPSPEPAPPAPPAPSPQPTPAPQPGGTEPTEPTPTSESTVTDADAVETATSEPAAPKRERARRPIKDDPQA